MRQLDTVAENDGFEVGRSGKVQQSQWKVQHSVHLGLFEFNVLPFVRTNSPAKVFLEWLTLSEALILKTMKVCFDDVVIFGNDPNELVYTLVDVLTTAIERGTYFK